MKMIPQYFLSFVRGFLSIILLGSVFLIVANSIGRYVFLAPIIWAEEILGYVLVWLVYLGSILITWDGGHLKMNLISRKLTGICQILVNGFGIIAFCGIGAIIVYQSFIAIGDLTHVSQVAEIPMNWLHSIIPISFFVIVGCIVIRFSKNLHGELDKEAEQVESLLNTTSQSKNTLGEL
ncbi:MAG: hypothetical protein CMM44_10760 [Rhodospirillaceae bacterium]|nr:hypothetical protein [Rhodospirillaceae bacterium]|tara:strand:+ start:6417 stop:6953 length:537 start_codon:yes stop_codon:yes gene_type:complete